MRFQLVSSCAAIAILALSGEVWAQDQGDDREVDRVIVTGSPLQVLADEVVGSAEVVTAEHIEVNLAGSLADTLSHEPGVSSTFFGPASSRPVIRGLGADRVRVLVNGVGLVDASTASPDHAVASEALEAERVEILRGPAAIAYGGGAIGGVVNVIDGRVPSEVPDGVDGRLYFGATSVDEGHQTAGRIRFGTGPFVFHAEALDRQAGNYSIPGFAESERFRELEHDDDHDDGPVGFAHDGDDEDQEEEEEDFGEVSNSDLQFQTGSLGVSLVQDWGYIGVAYKASDAEYGLPGHGHGHEEEHEDGEFLLAFDEDDHEEEEAARLVLTQTRWDVRGDINIDNAPIERVRFAFAAGDYKHREIEGEETATLFTNEGWEGRLELRHRDIGRTQGAFGLQTFSRDFAAEGAESFIQPVTTTDWGVFVVERFDADSWGLEGGIRFEDRDVETATASRSFNTFSASGAVFFRPQNNSFLALTAAVSQRAPTDVELFANGPHLATQSYEVGDASLDVETSTSLELTWRADVSGNAIEASVFHADFDGFIGVFPTGAELDELPVYQYRQTDASLTGFEGRIERELGNVSGWDLTGEALFEYVNGEVDGGGSLPRLPPLSITGSLEADRDFGTARIEVVWAAEQNETALLELPTDSYTLVNAQFVLRPIVDDGLRIIFEGRNLTDEEARLHASFLKDLLPLPGRNFRAAISYAF